nr:PEP-CTERM sorting domain-containing protein [Aquincola sp. J276]
MALSLPAGEFIYRVTGTATGAEGGLYTLSLTAPIPEPSSYALMLGGIAAVGLLAWRRRPD